jgi:hypothetical protein
MCLCSPSIRLMMWTQCVSPATTESNDLKPLEHGKERDGSRAVAVKREAQNMRKNAASYGIAARGLNAAATGGGLALLRPPSPVDGDESEERLQRAGCTKMKESKGHDQDQANGVGIITAEGVCTNNTEPERAYCGAL